MWNDFRIKRIFRSHTNRLKDFFSDLEIEKVIPELLQYFRETTKCKNAIWILGPELARLKSAADRGVEPDPIQHLLRSVHCQSLLAIEQTQIVTWLKGFAIEGLKPEFHKIAGETLAFFPVVIPGMDEPSAYLLLVGLPGTRPERTVVEVSQDLSCMLKHIAFSLKYWKSQMQAFEDELSGLYNAIYLIHVLESEIERSNREEKKFSVLFMDVDYFKSINDSKGHWVGSRVLAEMGRLFRKSMRKSDYAFRYGGDEFVVVLPNTDSNQAVVVAERLRNLIESNDFLIDGVHIRVTLSIGLATFPDHAKNCKDIIKMADEAMYSGKHKSRNTVFVAS